MASCGGPRSRARSRGGCAVATPGTRGTLEPHVRVDFGTVFGEKRMTPDPVQQRFTAALDALMEQVKEDRSILAAILCGSLSHDTVWAQSDIDLALVTIDDRKVESGSISLNADGVNVHAFLMPRAQFRATVEGSLHNSFMHSLLAKGRLLYTHDETIAGSVRRLQRARRSRPPDPAAARGDPRAAGDRQGAQVVRDPRRPRLHRAVDPLRGDAAGAGRGDWRGPARRPRGDSAGVDAESRRSSRPSTPGC